MDDLTNNPESEEKFAKAFRCCPQPFTLSTVREDRYIAVNDAFEVKTGYRREEAIGRTVEELGIWEDYAERGKLVERILRGEVIRNVECRFKHRNGNVFIGLLSAETIDIAGEMCVIANVIDVTEYKRAQELLQKADEKRSKAFRLSPMALMITSARDHRYLEVNEAFERLSGYSREEVIGRTPFDINVWVNPSDRLELVGAVQTGQGVRGKEYLFRTRDGRVLAGLSFADLIEIDGEPCVIAAALDITERKQMEKELQALSGKLITAQDEERRRIGAELNETFGQALSVLTMELGQLARRAHGDIARTLLSLSSKAQDLTTEVSIISQTLYPSTLEYVGLPWAIDGLCRQFMHLYGLQVGFKHEGLPAVIPSEIALGIYRIVQEGLRNVVLHSGTRQAWIELVVDDETIRLALWDKGIGFDVGSTQTGIGLITMRERCRRLNGELSIRAQAGTHIEVRLPLGRNAQSPV